MFRPGIVIAKYLRPGARIGSARRCHAVQKQKPVSPSFAVPSFSRSPLVHRCFPVTFTYLP